MVVSIVLRVIGAVMFMVAGMIVGTLPLRPWRRMWWSLPLLTVLVFVGMWLVVQP